MNDGLYLKKFAELREFQEFSCSHDVKMNLKNPYSKLFIDRIRKYIDSDNENIKLFAKCAIDIYENRKTSYFFVTINPREIELSQLKSFINLCQVHHKSWFECLSYSFEQRGETFDDVGKGKHIHMIIKKNDKKKSDVIRELFSTLKNYCSNPEHINVRKVKNDFEKCNVEKYMKGIKSTEKENKSKKCYFDEVFRNMNDLSKIYYN
jgi:hypothetical protein